ncbi:MAG: signal peptidase I [Candidatus Nanopelagicales bacterium]
MSSERTSSASPRTSSVAATAVAMPLLDPPSPHLRHELPPPNVALPAPAVPEAATTAATVEALPERGADPEVGTDPLPEPLASAPRHAASADLLAPVNAASAPVARHAATDPRADTTTRGARHATGEPTPTGARRHPGQRRLPTDSWPFWVELPVLLFIAFAVAFGVKTFVVQPFFIPSGSMENTLHIGDRVLVNKVVFHTRPIARGDIVVFNGVDSFAPEVAISAPTNQLAKVASWFGSLIGFAPPNESDFIKRVVGVAGDHVKCCDAQGRVMVNGVPLDERSYLFPGDNPSDQPFDVVVPPGKLWVMGDHRSGSSDSRSHLGDPGGGFVPDDKVIGRAIAVIWPLSDRQLLQIPATFDQPGLASPVSP